MHLFPRSSLSSSPRSLKGYRYYTVEHVSNDRVHKKEHEDVTELDSLSFDFPHKWLTKSSENLWFNNPVLSEIRSQKKSVAQKYCEFTQATRGSKVSHKNS